MAIIESDDPAAEQSSGDFLRDARINLQIEFDAVCRAILALSKKEIKSFTLDTGQNSQTVTRQDLPALIERQKSILDMIQDLSSSIGDEPVVTGQLIQVVPF
jgi:hypothetical protein